MSALFDLQHRLCVIDCKYNCHKKCSQFVPKDCSGGINVDQQAFASKGGLLGASSDESKGRGLLTVVLRGMVFCNVSKKNIPVNGGSLRLAVLVLTLTECVRANS